MSPGSCSRSNSTRGSCVFASRIERRLGEEENSTTRVTMIQGCIARTEGKARLGAEFQAEPRARCTEGDPRGRIETATVRGTTTAWPGIEHHHDRALSPRC